MLTHRIAAKCRRAFTLVELVTAMAITAVLVLVIMQLTNQSITLWKLLREDTASAATARIALQTISRDFEAFQMRTGNNNNQWISSSVDAQMRGVPRGLNIPRSARFIFFTCPSDHNPQASSTPESIRTNYRDMIANSETYQGSLSVVGYRLLFRDQVLNLPARSGDTESFPLFSLYRQVISPKDTYENLLNREDLQTAYTQYERSEEKKFLCENIIELSISFNIEYMDEARSGGSQDAPRYRSMVVPVLSTSTSRGVRSFRLSSKEAQLEGNAMQNVRVLSAEISITVLTEEGVALVEQVRQGQRKAPHLDEFFSRYTRSYSRAVTLPQPL